MMKNTFLFLRWNIFLIRFQQSYSDWKCCLSAYLLRILTPSQTFSRPQQDDWMVPQCRFISIRPYPLALIVPGHPWGGNPLCVSSWVGSGDALLHSIPSLYSNVPLTPRLPDTSTTGSEVFRGQWSFFLGFFLWKCWNHQESLEGASVLLQVLSCMPGLVINIEGSRFLQRSLIPPAEQPQGGRSTWKCWVCREQQFPRV